MFFSQCVYNCNFLFRACEAKVTHEEMVEMKKKLAETKLAQVKHAEELREANKKAIVEKAKIDLNKVRI